MVWVVPMESVPCSEQKQKEWIKWGGVEKWLWDEMGGKERGETEVICKINKLIKF